MLDDSSHSEDILDPIKIMLPWVVNQELVDLPEAKLIIAIFVMALEDANAPLDCSLRRKARDWFKSSTFAQYCGLLNTDGGEILSLAITGWGQGY